MDENIKQLIIIATELEAFKYKVYALLNKESWLDNFIMKNSPCNYNLSRLVYDIKQEKITNKIKSCEDSFFHGIGCLECENNQLGFFKSNVDIRPSSCTWINRNSAEKIYNLFKKKGR